MSAPSSEHYDLLDRLAEEFAGRHRRGERPALQEYVDRHPDLADEIRRLFPALVQVERAEVDRRATREPAEGAAAPLPRLVGDYRILREVGRGGMGVVYEAEQVSLGRRVALKVLPTRVCQDRVTLERFRREARSAAKLHHTNIVPVFEVGREGEISYYAMQFIQGQGLDLVIQELGRLRRGPHADGAGAPQRAAGATDPKTAPSRDRAVSQFAQSLLTGRFAEPPVDGASPLPGASTHPPPISAPSRCVDPTGAPPAGPVPRPAASVTSAASAVLPGGVELSTAGTGHGHQYYRSVARIGQQAAAALGYAHARGVVHRDIKPSNLLLDAAGVVWVTDFGLAKGEEEGLTQTGDILGTLRYMAPERFRGEGDGRADIYALGLTLYELLALRPAFDSPDRMRLIELVKAREPDRPRSVDPRIPRDLETIVFKAIDKDPRRRYPTAEALGEDLRRFLADEPIVARPVRAVERGWRWCHRNPVVAGSLGAVAAALVAVAGLALLHAAEQRRFAHEQAEASGEKGRLLKESNRRLALLNYERGQAACERGEIGPGLLSLIESWRSAIDAGDLPRQRAARANLAAWQRHFPKLKAVFSQEGVFPTHSLAFSPDGKTILTGNSDGTARLWDAATGRPIGATLRHDPGPVRVAFSPDGKSVLTGGTDGLARLWDAATGRPIGEPLKHDAWVFAVAFSPDGKTALTGSHDGTARLWDVATGKPVGVPLSHGDQVWAVAFSPDGKAALTGGRDGKARLWVTATGRPIGEPLSHGGPVRAVAFSPDGKAALTGSWDKTARLWDAANGHPLGAPLGHLDAVYAVAFSPDGKAILTGSDDKTARLWDAATAKPIGAPLEHLDGVFAVAFSPDGKSALTGSHDGTARLWDVATGKPVGIPLPHQGPIRAVAFSPDGKSALTGSHDGTARLWDAATGKPVGIPLPHQGPIRAVAFSPDGKSALTGSDDRSARLWDIPPSPHCGILQHDARVVCAAFGPDGKTILTASVDTAVQLWLWDTATGQPIRTPLPHQGRVQSVAFSPDGKTVLTGSFEGTARLWVTATGRPIGEPLSHGDHQVWAVAFSPDGKSALTGTWDGTAQVWDLATMHTIGTPLRHRVAVVGVVAVAFSPDGKSALTGSFEGTARLWEIATGRPIGEPLKHGAQVQSVAFSPDGKSALTGSYDGTARLWDAATGRPIGVPLKHRARVYAVAFSPDGKAILTGSADKTARLWDAATGQPLGASLRHEETVFAVAFSPDGKVILTGSADKTARLWPTADLPDDLDRIATWVEALTGLTLDASGSIQPLDRDAWLERREEVQRQGGPPVRP